MYEATLVEAGRKAIDRFVTLHPDISGTAVEALAWCYTWDYK